MLSKTPAHGLRIGFIVGPAELIGEMRALRRLITRHVPSNNAHIASLFIAQGHHDAFIRKLNMTYRERRATLVAALQTHLPSFGVLSQGGSGAWIRGPEGLDSQQFALACAAQGVLLEPGEIFFSNPSAATRSCFRLVYSAIANSAIESGVEVMRQVFEELYHL
ncbi:MAG: aminotransferase class I/II-fold pyridoxal phosphate-dependent enzyme [Pseudomonadota bacterium]